MPLHAKVEGDGPSGRRTAVDPLLAGEVEDVLEHRAPDGPMEPEVDYKIVQDEFMVDKNVHLNVATFVTTYMEPQAKRLMAEKEALP